MCGIVGYINQQQPIDRGLFLAMRDTLAHRGPDGAGAEYFDSDTIALGHRRLSFLDLSEAGTQPMCNEDKTIWIVLNGEIYNYQELRTELLALGHLFKSHTDTEVIIHGYEAWGMFVLDRLKGMFAFGLLDFKHRKLFLARDRFGIKPLYYSTINGTYLFASELKAIVRHPSFKREMDLSAFADYFVYRYIPSPKTIWKNIQKLPPAHYAEIDYQKGEVRLTEYWKLMYSESKIMSRDLIAQTNEMLSESVSIHARSDVPLGSFLSGGYDSSAIAYYMTALGLRPDTFSIGFEGWERSEDQYAAIVANHLKLPFSSIKVSDGDLDLLDLMPQVYDEPIADISILPTYLVSQLASKKVKAVMSGEGADELFGGYQWQQLFYTESQKKSPLKSLFQSKNSKKTEVLDFYAQAMAMGRFDQEELKQMLPSSVYTQINPNTNWFYAQHLDSSLTPLKSIQKLDIKCFMGELVLTKIDRASMANSLEVRVPFLDHQLFELLFSSAENTYYKPTITKFLLHENIKNVLPKEILDRKKQGFVGPDSFYMNSARYQQVLDQSKLIDDGLINKEYYLNLLSNQDHWRLWKFTIMELWYRQWMK